MIILIILQTMNKYNFSYFQMVCLGQSTTYVYANENMNEWMNKQINEWMNEYPGYTCADSHQEVSAWQNCSKVACLV